jgi:hypothetical protein
LCIINESSDASVVATVNQFNYFEFSVPETSHEVFTRENVFVKIYLENEEKVGEKVIDYSITFAADRARIMYFVPPNLSQHIILDIRFFAIPLKGSPFCILPRGQLTLMSTNFFPLLSPEKPVDCFISEDTLYFSQIGNLDSNFNHFSAVELGSMKVQSSFGEHGRGSDSITSIRFAFAFLKSIVVVEEAIVDTYFHQKFHVIKIFSKVKAPKDHSEQFQVVKSFRIQVDFEEKLIGGSCVDNKIYIFFWDKVNGTSARVYKTDGVQYKLVTFTGPRNKTGYSIERTQVKVSDNGSIIFRCKSPKVDEGKTSLFDFHGNIILNLNIDFMGVSAFDLNSAFVVLFHESSQVFKAYSVFTSELILQWTIPEDMKHRRLKVVSMTNSEEHIYVLACWIGSEEFIFFKLF